MTTDHDLYGIIGVPRFSDIETVKKSYRKIASQHHPDKIGPNEYFSKVTAAYNTLSDSQKKELYDRELKRESFSGFMYAEELLTAICTVRISDLYSEEWKILNLNTELGKIAIKVKLDGGLETGDRVKYPGVGPQGQTVMLIYKILPDANYSKHGLDLCCNLSVDVLQLLCGCEKTITTPDDREWKIKIPSPIGKPKKLKLPGLGFKSNGKVGDFYVEVHPQFSEISEELKQQISKEIITRGK
jgi:DnaJ-class molecular chaperone